MTITITDTTTNESVALVEPDHEPGEHDEWPPWIWIEGNYACDCNRYLFFLRAKGQDVSPDNPRCVCGHGRYKVKIEQDGEPTYDENQS